jgi:uncharacterized SAM-binding protein YcdF (DUF218 family)
VLLSVVKVVGPPGSIPLLALCLVAGWAVLRFRPRRRRLAQVWIAGVVAVYGVLAVPIVSHAIAARLPEVASPDRRTLGPLDTVVVFDGDNRVGRTTTAAEIFRVSSPAQVIVLGQPWLVRRLVTLGVPSTRIVLEGNPPTTQDQMAWIRTHTPARTGARSVVVVSRLQLPRVAAMAQAQGQAIVFVASPVDIEPPSTGAWSLVPSYASLRASRDAIYELAALAYYDWRGLTHAAGN